jgi:type I restriction enzyme, S subunit
MLLKWLPMAQVAPLVRRPVEIDPEALYPEIGVRSFGRGTFHKPDLEGAAVGTKRLFESRSGDLLFNIVFAWEGAVAVAQPSDHGRFGSHRFLTCVCDPQLAEPNFLEFYFATQIGRAQLLQASPGGAGRNRTLGLRALEDIRVPLPPLEEQRRLVAQIDRINASVNEARSLLQNAADETLKVSRALLYGRSRVASPLVSVGDLVRQRRTDVIVSPDEEYHFAGVYSFGRGVFAGEKKKVSSSHTRCSRASGQATSPIRN